MPKKENMETGKIPEKESPETGITPEKEYMATGEMPEAGSMETERNKDRRTRCRGGRTAGEGTQGRVPGESAASAQKT